MRYKIAIGILLVALLVLAYVLLAESGALAVLLDEGKLHALVGQTGWYGPLVLIGLMIAAIVMSPIPSAPIAVAAGMAYGHFWGMILVVVGAGIGAMIAFAIGRLAGHQLLERWFGDRLRTVRLFGSQNAMTLIVFVSRLLPFVSFDIVSYAAGLTPLRFWRFALATFAGVIPMSFLLAHFGSELVIGESGQIMATVLLLGLVTLLPFAGRWLVGRYRRRNRR
jgi:uncharacterized membrane protein YdjX (TVP38/TMEM64 family)